MVEKSSVNNSRFPDTLDCFYRMQDGYDEVTAREFNDAVSAIEAIQQTLGLIPNGLKSTIVDRIKVNLDTYGKLQGWKYLRVTGGGQYQAFHNVGEFTNAPKVFLQVMGNPSPSEAGFSTVAYAKTSMFYGIASVKKGGGTPTVDFDMAILFVEPNSG